MKTQSISNVNEDNTHICNRCKKGFNTTYADNTKIRLMLGSTYGNLCWSCCKELLKIVKEEDAQNHPKMHKTLKK